MNTLEALADQAIDDIMHQEEHVLWPRTLSYNLKPLLIYLLHQGQMDAFLEQGAALPDVFAVRELEQPHLKAIKEPSRQILKVVYHL